MAKKASKKSKEVKVVPQGQAAKLMRKDPEFAKKVRAEQEKVRAHNKKMDKKRSSKKKRKKRLTKKKY